LFLKAVTSSRVPQGSDGAHMKIYIWQGLVASDEYRQKTAFALATSQNPNQVKSCDSRATSHSLQPNRKSKI
jgi:hypothetical protein